MNVTPAGGKTSAQQVLGRPRVTSRAAMERLAFELFARKGFDKTTVDEIAAAAGIGRRTFFRYFSSKNDLVWGDFEEQIRRLRRLLEVADRGMPIMDVVRHAVVEFNRFDPQEVPWHRQRMQLILGVPTLQADATLRYGSWRAVIIAFVAGRTGLPEAAMAPQLAGNVVLAAALTAYQVWLSDEGEAALSDLLDEAIRQVGAGLSAVLEDTGDQPAP